MIILTHFNKSIQASREVKIDVWLCEVVVESVVNLYIWKYSQRHAAIRNTLPPVTCRCLETDQNMKLKDFPDYTSHISSKSIQESVLLLSYKTKCRQLYWQYVDDGGGVRARWCFAHIISLWGLVLKKQQTCHHSYHSCIKCLSITFMSPIISAASMHWKCS